MISKFFIPLFVVLNIVLGTALYAVHNPHGVTHSMHTHGDTMAPDGDSCSKYFFNEDCYADSLEAYEERFGINKTVPDSLKLAFYVALSYYPELYDAKIEVESRPMFTTMQARPSSNFIFKKKANRTYKIYINDRKGKHKGIHLAKLNFNMRVGFFGHELAHLYSYHVRSKMQVLGMGLKYVFSKDYKRYTERETDMETVRRGLGFPLYESKIAILHGDTTCVPPEYRNNSSKNYLSDCEVLDAIRHVDYQNIAVK